MPPHLKKSINQAHLENGTYEQIVSHLEKELELNGLEAPDEVPINTVTQQAPQPNSEKPKPTCLHCQKPGHYQNQCQQLKLEKDQTGNIANSANRKNGSDQTNSNPNKKVSNKTKASNTYNQDLDLSSHPVRPPVVELTTPKRNVTLKQTQRTDLLPGKDDRKDKTKSSREMRKATHMGTSNLQPKF